MAIETSIYIWRRVERYGFFSYLTLVEATDFVTNVLLEHLWSSTMM